MPNIYFSLLSGCIRDQCHKPGAFYRLGQFALMFGAGSGFFPRQNLGIGGKKSLKCFGVFVVNFRNPVGAEMTDFDFW
jgi:hypothetical protein